MAKQFLINAATRQRGQRSEALSTMTIPGLTERPRGGGSIPHHDIGPRERAPRLALVADLQGQELNGMFVLSRLAAFLRDIDAGERRDLRLRERVLVVPTVGHAPAARGTGAQQAARLRWAMTEAVMAVTQSAYYRVAIHPSPDIEEMPQVRLYAPNDDERASACLFGLPAVIERPLEPGDAPALGACLAAARRREFRDSCRAGRQFADRPLREPVSGLGGVPGPDRHRQRLALGR